MLFWFGNTPVTCFQSQNKRWFVGDYKRNGVDTLKNNSIALFEGVSRRFSLSMGKDLSVKALCVSNNGTFVFCVFKEPDIKMQAVIVMSSEQKELFKLETETHLTASSISELGRYLALSFANSKNKDCPYASKIEVFDLINGEVIFSKEKNDDIRYADIEVLEPDGDVIAFFKGKKVGLITVS